MAHFVAILEENRQGSLQIVRKVLLQVDGFGKLQYSLGDASLTTTALLHETTIPSIVELPSCVAALQRIRLPDRVLEVAESPIKQGLDQRGYQTYGRHAVPGIKECGAVQLASPMIYDP